MLINNLKLSSQICLWVIGVCKRCKATSTMFSSKVSHPIFHAHTFISPTAFSRRACVRLVWNMNSSFTRNLFLRAGKSLCVFFVFFLCAYTIFDRSSPKCSLRKFLGEVLSGHATHILHCFNSMRQLGDELERTENNTGRVKEYIRLSSYCIWIFSFVLVCVKAVTCSKCPCVHFVSSTPSAEYIMCSRPCAFMWRVVLVQ